MTGWTRSTIRELARGGDYAVVGGPFGSSLGRRDYVSDGVPVIRGAQLAKAGGFSHDDLVFVTERKADEHRGNLATPGDIIVTQRGTVGQVARIPVTSPYRRYLLSQSQMKLSVDEKRADPRFVCYALTSPEVQQRMRNATISAGVPHINLATFRDLTIDVPPLPKQARIADVLLAFDDLIECNRRRIEILEDTGRSLYREWFVDFRCPGLETAEIVETTAGPIPSNWARRTLGDLATWFSGGTPSTKVAGYWDGDIPWITSGSLTSFLVDDSDRRLTPGGVAAGSRLVERDTVLFVVRGMSLAKEFRHGIADVPLAFGQDCKALVAQPAVDPLFLAFAVDALSSRIQGMVEFAAHGTGKLSTDRLKSLPVATPGADHQTAFARAVRPVRELMSSLQRQERRVEEARRLLLPKLVAGRIDVDSLAVDDTFAWVEVAKSA